MLLVTWFIALLMFYLFRVLFYFSYFHSFINCTLLSIGIDELSWMCEIVKSV